MVAAFKKKKAHEAVGLAVVLLSLWLPPPAAHAAVDDAAGTAEKKATTVEQLELRIERLEAILEAQRQALEAQRLSSPSASPRPGNQLPALAKEGVTEQQAASVTTSNPQIFAGPGGFSIQSIDGADQIRFHGEFDFDGRFFDDGITPEGSRSTWLLRRARPIVEGTFANLFDFRFNPDFAGGRTVIQDAFVAARFNPLFVLTAGKFKEPFGLERLQFSPNNRFIELGLPSDLVPNRDLGIQVSGTYGFATGDLIYQVGWFNGVSDGSSTDANNVPDIDNNDSKDWVVRVFAQPFAKTDSDGLKGIGAGVALSYVKQVGTATNTLLPTYRTETQRSFFAYDGARPASATTAAGATTVAGATSVAGATYADGQRLRISPQAYYYYKSLGLLAEYVQESQDVARTLGTAAGAFTHRGTIKPDSWQLLTTYSLTGDDATFGTVSPHRPYAVGQPGWGSVELAARISELEIGSAAFANASNGAARSWFADPTSQASKAVAWTLGVNWYLTQNVLWNVDYTKTRFDGGALGGGSRPNEAAYFTRFQVAF